VAAIPSHTSSVASEIPGDVALIGGVSVPTVPAWQPTHAVVRGSARHAPAGLRRRRARRGGSGKFQAILSEIQSNTEKRRADASLSEASGSLPGSPNGMRIGQVEQETALRTPGAASLMSPMSQLTNSAPSSPTHGTTAATTTSSGFDWFFPEPMGGDETTNARESALVARLRLYITELVPSIFMSGEEKVTNLERVWDVLCSNQAYFQVLRCLLASVSFPLPSPCSL
jgi:hypothetical protein